MNTPGSIVPPIVLSIDIGSSSVRTLLFDARGQALAGSGARAAYELQAASDGSSITDADALLERVFQCIDTTLAQAGSSRIAAVGIDTLASTFLAVDRTGQPLTPLISYADTRNDQDATALRAELDEHAVHQRTGCLVRTSYWPARLAWLKRTNPAVWSEAAYFLTIGAYLEWRLFGSPRTGVSTASWTGMLHRNNLTWDSSLLKRLGCSAEQLGQLADTADLRQGLQEPFASRWPGLRSTPWLAAVGDGAAANIGSGCCGPGRVALTVGTTGALRVVRSSVAHVPAGLWCYRVDAQRALLGGATSEGGNVYAWLSRSLKLGEPESNEAELATRIADQHGLTVLPFWAGERSPGWAGDAKAAILGMTMATTPLDLLHASLEAVAYRFALIAASLLGGSGQANEIVVSGGSLRQSPAWTQIVADVLGHPLILADEPEATSRGTALLALEAIGAISSVEVLPIKQAGRVIPRPANSAIYAQALERQRKLYTLLFEAT